MLPQAAAANARVQLLLALALAPTVRAHQAELNVLLPGLAEPESGSITGSVVRCKAPGRSGPRLERPYAPVALSPKKRAAVIDGDADAEKLAMVHVL